MVHRNAPLTPTGRLRLARCVIEHGWTLRQAAERFQVAHTTAKRWADRYRTHGPAGMGDRSSIPRHQPGRTPAHIEQQVVGLRTEHRIGPVRLAARTGLAMPALCAALVDDAFARHGAHQPAPAVVRS